MRPNCSTVAAISASTCSITLTSARRSNSRSAAMPKRGRLLAQRVLVDVGECQAGALGGEAAGDGEADAGGRRGDDDNFVLKAHH